MVTSAPTMRMAALPRRSALSEITFSILSASPVRRAHSSPLLTESKKNVSWPRMALNKRSRKPTRTFCVDISKRMSLTMRARKREAHTTAIAHASGAALSPNSLCKPLAPIASPLEADPVGWTTAAACAMTTSSSAYWMRGVAMNLKNMKASIPAVATASSDLSVLRNSRKSSARGSMLREASANNVLPVVPAVPDSRFSCSSALPRACSSRWLAAAPLIAATSRPDRRDPLTARQPAVTTATTASAHTSDIAYPPCPRPSIPASTPAPRAASVSLLTREWTATGRSGAATRKGAP
mmetsp:Transcript_25282/g.88211  ORF Transcript_25282/g.88211 Transcript_25282/m.88211 type:complete len:296 (-) Transcript_25282:510-1397(-)